MKYYDMKQFRNSNVDIEPDVAHPLVVGINAANPHSGKTTVAGMMSDYLNESGIECIQYSFGTAVKLWMKELAVLRGVPKADAHTMMCDDKRSPHPIMNDKTGGYLLSTFAMSVRERVDQDFWMSIVRSQILDEYASNKRPFVAIIDDMRFANEALMADACVFIDRVYTEAHMGYDNDRDPASEGQLRGLPFDYVIANNGTPAHLQRQAEFVIKDIVNGSSLMNGVTCQ